MTVDEDFLAERFEAHGTHLRAVAYGMLGSLSEADDAVQETWLRLRRSDSRGIDNLGGWLTTVVARVCLDVLRSRMSRREEPLGTYMPEPIVSREAGAAPAPDADLRAQREVVDAFFAATRDGDFDALVAVLDPDVVLRSDGGTGRPAATRVLYGAAAVAEQALTFSRLAPFVRRAPRESPWPGADGRSRCWASPSGVGRSPRSTCSPTRSASPCWSSSTR